MSKGSAGFAVLFFAASFLAAAGLRAADLGQVPWFVSRSSGIVAFIALSTSVIMGLLISTKAADGLVPRPMAFDLHQFLSVLSLSLIGVHAGSLLFDGFLRFSPLELLVPFTAPYRPLWTGVGVIAAWLTAIVTSSFWARKRIGQKRWRKLHYVTFVAYLAGLVHGMGSGTDSQLAPVFWMYVVSAGAVAWLTAYRITTALEGPSRSTKPSVAATARRERAR